MAYPTSIKIIRIPCTGKVDSLHILRAFEKGADGVYVVGCREGDCHYNNGNFRAKKRVEQVQEILDTIGIGGHRVRMCNLSSSDGPLFVKFAEEMHEKITEAGPNPIKSIRANKASVADPEMTAQP
jgi:coenzyme F420-reducing hydrogenase delta subunit